MTNEASKSELISIIVPTHNCEKFVKKTIGSILDQTYTNLEVIVIDDYSTDSTVEQIKSIQTNRIVLLINDKQSGAAFSRNRGIIHAKGEYIAFLDGDDVWHKTKLEEQLAFMKENNYLFSCTNYDEIDENDNSRGVVVSGPRFVDHKTFLKTDYVGCLTVIFKRDIYPDLQIPVDILKRNDYALWLKLSEKATCYRLDKVLASYRRTSNSLSSGNKFKLIKYHEELFQKLYHFGRVKSFIFALRNVFYFIYRRIRYVKKV